MPLNFDLLPDKPQAQKQRSLNFDLLPDKPPRKSLFPQISPEEQVKHPVLTGIAETGRDVLAPGFHFANQLLLDYPRRITEHLGYEYPSGNESGENVLGLMKRKPVAGTLAGIAGVAGGLKNPILKVLGGGMGAGLGKNVLTLAATGAAYSPSKFESPGQVAEEQITKAIGGAFLPIVGKAISKAAPIVSGFGKIVVSKGAGLSKTAMDTVSRLGFKKVREVADKGVNYIQEDVIPRARQSLIKNITSAGDASKELLQDMGFNPDQIKSVMKISKQNMNKYGKMVSESWVKTEKNLGKALTNVGKQIGEVYTKAAKEGQKINIKNTLGTMRKQLRGLGVVDDAGNLLGDYKTHPSSAVRNLAQIYSEYAPRVGKGDISVPDFFNFRTRLQASIVKFPEGEKFNVPIYITNKVLKEDSINSLIQKGSPYEKFWRDLNKEYSDLETLDYLTKKITTVANNLPNKILTQRNKLTEKHMKLYGKDIVSDVDAYNAARELYPEKETFSVFNPQKQLIREAYKRTEMLKEAVKPVTEPIGRTAQKAGQWGANRVQQYMEAPLVSPKIKSFFAQAPGQVGAKLKGKSGQAIFGKEEPQKPVFGAKPQEALKTVADVEKMISEKSKVYGSRNGFLASDEYKKLYPQVEKIYAENKNNFVSKASKALEENNIKIGDRVSTLAQGFSGGESVSGTVISKEGIPYVKLDSPQMTQGGYKKQVQWHKGWRKSQELTPTPIQKPIAQPAKDLQDKPGIVEGEALTAAEAVKQGMGAEEFVKTKYGIAEEDVLYHGTNLPKGEKIEYVEPRIGDFTRTMYAGAGEGTFEEMGGKPLAYYKTHKDINKIKQYATGVAVYPKKGEPYILLTKRPGDALLVKEDGLYDTRGDIVTRDIPLGAENGDIISEESSRILAQIPLKKYNQLLSEYEAAKKAQGKGTALGLAGLTAAGTAMAGQAQAEEEKTLGQKNNNPINLKAFDEWDGMTGKDAQGHAVFKDLDYGIRANLKNLYNHQRKHPEQTLAQYLSTFAEANSGKEAIFIAKKLGITTDAKLKTINMDDMIIPLAEFESKTKLTRDDVARIKNRFNL